ncbi:MAG TPA: ABC transporter ATP-binding protein [Bacteroidota bacterium]
MATLRLEGITKSYGAHAALQGIDLEMRSGEFFSVLGPSGCGKTTLLRVIAGLEVPSSGRVLLDSRDVTALPPQERGIGMVFQNYALFPHMSVFRNVAFGLRSRHMKEEAVRARVTEVLAAVGLAGRLETPVPHLSGGEQQRVAVARALVIEPDLLLFDEPLSNLDAALRLRTREEIRRLQRSTGITTVYVTHDQAEAMSLSDRVAVMQAGRLEQVDTPQDMYAAPRSLFVAGFLGGGTMLEGVIDRRAGAFRSAAVTLPLPADYGGPDGEVIVSVRPEAVSLAPVEGGRPATEAGPCGRIEDREFLGFTTTAVVLLGDVRLHAAAVSSEATRAWAPGTTVCVRLDWSRCAVFRRP